MLRQRFHRLLESPPGLLLFQCFCVSVCVCVRVCVCILQLTFTVLGQRVNRLLGFGLELKVSGLGFRVSGFRVQGLGFRV